jgi:hypothetical protein
MAVAQGYGKTVTSGSVFAYDTGDTRNSYIGQPTVNLLYSAGATNLINGGGDIYGRCTKTDLGNGKFRFVNNGTGVSTVRLYPNQPDLIDGATYNSSVYFENLIGGLSIDWCDVGITGLNYSTATSGRLAGYSSRGSYAAPYYFLDINFDTGGAVTLYDPQVELKSYTTPFVAGTRSATQGLLPLVGNSTLDLSNVSFNSNAQMVFDGTDDYINTTKTATALGIYDAPYTMEAVFKVTNTISGDNMVFGTDQTAYRQGMHNGLRNGNIYFAHYSADYAAGSVALNEMVHVLWVYDGTTAFIYKNGVLQGSSNIASFIGTTNIQVGRSWSYFQGGEIPVAKIYNRALTAAEVKQNFDFYNARFGIEYDTYYFAISNRATRYNRRWEADGTEGDISGENMATTTPAYTIYQKPDASFQSPDNYIEVARDDIGTPTRLTEYGVQTSYKNGKWFTSVTVYKGKRGGPLRFEFPNGGTSTYGEEFYKTIVAPYVS